MLQRLVKIIHRYSNHRDFLPPFVGFIILVIQNHKMKKLLFISVIHLAFACSKEDEAVNSTKDFQPGVYGTQEWTIVNASHTTYRDGTPIPQVSNKPEWYKLKTLN